MVGRLKSLPRLVQVVVALALVALCGCCGVVGVAIVWPTADATPTEVADRSVPTLQPTFTPLPLTDTPILRTETPVPTYTPLPTDTALPADTPLPAEPERTEATVVRVVDGDTIEVAIGGETYSLGYIGIDTPETGDPMGAEATAANSDLVAGQTVCLEKDVSETDQYGRLLRYVYLADGAFVNAELVRLGFAQAEASGPDTKYQDLLEQMEQEARNAQRGMWAAAPPPPTATPPAAAQPTAPAATKGPPPGAEVLAGGIWKCPTDTTGAAYVGSSRSDKFHYLTCRYAGDIALHNRICFASREAAVAYAYQPCGGCKP